MKKLAGLFLAATLVFSMTTVAFAAGSKQDTVTPGYTNEDAIIVTGTSSISDEVKKEAGIEEKDGKLVIADETVDSIKTALNAKEVKILEVFDVTAPANWNKQPIWITITGAKWQDGLKVLHFEDGKWVALETKEGENGTVLAQFTKFSPTALAVVTTEAATEAAPNGGSPKTGEANTALYVTLLAVVAGASAYAAKRKFA